MKRSLLIFSAFLFCLVYWACQKNKTMVTIPGFQDPFITPAIEYLKRQITERNFEKLDFNSVQTLKTSGFTTGISIGKKDKADHEFVFIQKIANEYEGNWVHVQNRDSANSGILISTSFDDNLKSEVTFLNGRALKIIKTDHGISTTTLIKYKKDKALSILANQASSQIRMSVQSTEDIDDNDWILLPPVTVTMQQNNTPVTLYSIYWMNPVPTYNYSYTNLPQSGSSSGGSLYSYSISIVSGDNKIGDIRDYLKCFTNVPGSDHTYKVTLCVDQPAAGTRTAWKFSSVGTAGSSSGGNPVNVGHAFLVLTEITPTGTTTRNVGFYPQGSVTPYSPSDQGQLNNDAAHSYNIALTMTVNNSQFFNILNFISRGNNAGYNYELNGINCTSFALEALNQGGIHLNATIGSWPGGSGNNPGDLGEDIRIMQLSSNMSRTTISRSHPNVGNCYY